MTREGIQAVMIEDERPITALSKMTGYEKQMFTEEWILKNHPEAIAWKYDTVAVALIVGEIERHLRVPWSRRCVIKVLKQLYAAKACGPIGKTP